MKKRILCIALVVLMLCSMFLVSCDKKRSEEEIINDIVNSGTVALTVSVWLPTDADASSPEFQARLAAVEQGINDILDSRSESTRVKLVAVSDAEYEAKLAERFASMKDKVASGESALTTALKYTNKAQKVYFDNGSYMYELAYPEVLDTQLDLFVIRGYDNFVSALNNGNLRELDSYLFDAGSKYSNLTKMIMKPVFDQMKSGGKTYGIPNNHRYGDKYQYILVNKELLDAYEGLDADGIESILSCEDFIKSIGTSGNAGIIPLVATEKDIANFVYFSSDGKQSVMGSSNGTFGFTFSDDDYNAYTSFYKRLNDLSYVKSSLADGEKAAVRIFYGTNTDVKEYENDYYVVKSQNPIISEDDVFASVFAISTYSANYDRSMRILNFIQTNEEIRTLLQYGIKGEDYTLEYDENNVPTIKVSEDTAYKMNILYTGNGYTTYPADGTTAADWQDVIDMNHDTELSPYIYLRSKITALSGEDKTSFENALKGLEKLSNDTFTVLNAYTAEQYDKFVTDFKNASSVRIRTTLEETIADYRSKLESEDDEAKKAEYQAILDGLTNELVVNIITSEDYKTVLSIIKKVK